MKGSMKGVFILWGAVLFIALVAGAALAEKTLPNILVIFGDDIGYWNISAYNHGTMGYWTPNIDRIAKEGMMFTDHYAHPSCTPGRAAFITGQLPIRTGLTTVGLPGSPQGLKKEDPTLAEVLKPLGYMNGQFGKNHLGDRNEHLPTVHGFDEFFGNLYHLNVEEEPEQIDYPKDPAFRQRFGPRGVLHSWATNVDDPTEDPRSGRVGKQKIISTGPLTRKRMETIDEEFLKTAIDFMGRSVKARRPFFVWLSTTRMHVYTHLKPEHRYLAAPFTTEEDIHGSGMIEHDGHIGQLLKALDDLRVTDNTIVIYTTDNGPEHNMWPFGGTTPFRGEKLTTYEGGVRVPFLVLWHGKIPAGSISNGIQTHEDVFATLAAAVGIPNVREKLKKEAKVYIDGENNLDYWLGKSKQSARNHVFYYYESKLTAIRLGPWKAHFLTKESYWGDETIHAFPVFFNLHMDPFESFSSLDARGHLAMRKNWLFQPALILLQEHLKSLQEYPPRQVPASFNIEEIIQNIIRNRQRQ